MGNIKGVFGNNLRDRRKRHNLTQEQLAASIGLSTSALNEIERGRVWPQHRTIQALAKALSIDETAFFHGPPADPSPEHALEILRRAVQGPPVGSSPTKREIIEMLSAIDDSELGLMHATLRRLTDPGRSATAHEKGNNRKETK